MREREFINKKDRNGKKIREGDIMKCPALIGWEHANRNGIVEEWGAEYRIHTQNGLEPKKYFEKSIVILITSFSGNFKLGLSS